MTPRHSPARRPPPPAVQDTARERHVALVAAACRQIEGAGPAPDLAQLAGAAGLSPFHFHRVFKQVTGLTPRRYAEAHRALQVQAELARGARVTDAVFAAGFGSSSRFYEEARSHLGMQPAQYRDGGRDSTIRFAVAQCSLGALLVAASDVGLCAILMGDDPEALVHDLQDRFRQAQLIGADSDFERWVAQVVGLVESPGIGLDLPLDLRGTAFQRRVWEALRRIPAGETISYAKLAAKLGQPRAVRAIARACAANPLAVAVPCHRVLRTDGSLSGYRWGVARKRELLAREQTGRGA
jgi:AraC family transcriptional regulator of adaptative response/methylated-DNA-[protein]-cysteine methyltransferase